MMLGMKQLSKLGLFTDDTVFCMTGVTILKSRDAERAYMHAIAAMLRGKDCAMKTVSTFHENYDDIYEDAEDLDECRYIVDAERAYQEVKALIEEHETMTEA